MLFKRFLPIVFLLIVLCVHTQLFADTASDLKAKIEERNNQIKQLEAEISQYNLEVLNAQNQSKTLQSTIKTLDLTSKKLTTDITLTNSKISKTQLTIQELSDEINKDSVSIDTNTKSISQMLKNMQMVEDQSLVEIILSQGTIKDVWNDLENIKTIQKQIADKSNELRIEKKTLEDKQTENTKQKNQLQSLKQNLNDQKQVVVNNKQEKATLLTQTKNKESTFKELIKTKEQLKTQFEKDVYDFESQLNITIDSSSYPAPLHGILSWPLDNIYITQLFGVTSDSKRLYLSGSHNGVDFRATVGTPVKSVLDGIVAGTGNTDAYSGCYSFGKWIMIKHDNGLSTIYGHLSVISTSQGKEVKTGDIIGYSGNTGYTTGPHLHISLYATQGVRIEQFVQSKGCKQAIIPLADVKAYLDPMLYFPDYK